jgi:DNA excision repair protein ERCC-2
MLTADKVYQAGANMGLCPFELSLDLTLAADLIVCDLNYVFDPGVYLKRFFLNRDYSDSSIDEAHNLHAAGSLLAELKRKELQSSAARSNAPDPNPELGVFSRMDELDRYQKRNGSIRGAEGED